MDLPTHVALQTSGEKGSTIQRLHRLAEGWTFAWPEFDAAPFSEIPCLIAGEEFDALVFDALHGFYRQSISVLRVALEIMTIAAGYAVSNDRASFDAWQRGDIEGKFGQGRVRIRDSAQGRQIDNAGFGPIFADVNGSWINLLYKELCGFAHGRAGYDNGALWRSNGPIYVRSALELVESRFRQTLAMCYLLMRLAWDGYQPSEGQRDILAGDQSGWSQYDELLRQWIL